MGTYNATIKIVSVNLDKEYVQLLLNMISAEC